MGDRGRFTRYLFLAGALCVVPTALSGAANSTSARATSASSTTTSTPSSNAPVTTLGPNGVVSSAVVAENRKEGTRSWVIAANASGTVIQGFANLTYARQGQTLDVYVSSRAAHYRAVAYRMGWYQGLGAREIWSSPIESGVVQPACDLNASVNMVSCDDWRMSFSVPITSAFVPGDYLIKLEAGPRAASYVPLTIWDPSSTATYVVMSRSLVEEGWNTYGGYSFYAGEGPCIIDDATYPPCNRARVVSFDRPYASGFGASDFLTNEYPLVQLMEREGLDVTYISDVTLNDYPDLLLHHKVLLTLDHDEGWTYSMRVAVERAMSQGVNAVYFGAAAMVRHDRLQPSPLGADREVVDYRDAAEDPLDGVGNPMEVTANTWGDPPSDWSPVDQIGEEYSGYLEPQVTVPMVISDAASWVFAHTNLRDGSSLANVIASDIDHATPDSPGNVEILAHSPIPAGEAVLSGGVWNGEGYSDMIYFTDPQSEAGVIDTGNNVWIADLRSCTVPGCAAGTVKTITNNILRVFGQGPAGVYEPPAPNADQIFPLGS